MTTGHRAAQARMERFQQWLTQQGVAAAFITPGTNFTYLCGWSTNPHERLTGLLLPAQGAPALIVPKLDQESASGSAVADIVAWPDGDDPYALVAEVARSRGVAGVPWAFEKQVMTMHQYEGLAAAAGVRAGADAGQCLSAMRLIKSPDEVALLQRAADFLNPALDAARAAIRPGATERQVRTALVEALAAAGSEGQPFSAIVLAGANSAMPHGVSGDRVIQSGEYVLIDFGGLCGGYCSDITRTFLVGDVSDRAAEIYGLVLAAHDAAIVAIRPGVACGEVDRAARDVIEKAGYGQYYIHRTGHGLGIDVHEEPSVYGANPLRLEPGMVFTVEPGIYIPGWGGVRIEEVVVVTETGAKVLTTYPNDRPSMIVR